MENMIEKGFAEKVKQGASSKYIKVHTATRWNIRHSLMLHWFADLMNVTEVTIHRRNVSTLLSSAFIRGDLSAATRSPFIWSLGQRTSLPVEDIINLLSFCLKTTQFTYGSTYYLKVFGTAMGSPVSAVIANMVMEDVEQRALATSPVKPFFWKRYVDDVIFLCSIRKWSGAPLVAFKFSRAVDPIHPWTWKG